MSTYADHFVSKHLDRLKGTMLERADINVRLKDGNVITNDLRVTECARFLDRYTEGGKLKVVLMSHQGRQGDDQYLESLEPQARALNAFTKRTEVLYSDSLGGEETDKAVRGLGPGQALLLKNVRSDPDEKRKFISQEEQRKSDFVRRLSRSADFYVNDAVASMHRGDTSNVGFLGVLPSYLGLQMEYELGILDEMKAELASGRRVVIIFGGSKWEKFENVYTIIANNKNVIAACGGIPGQTLSYLANRGCFNKENEEFILKTGGLDTAAKLLKEFPERVIYPDDFILASREDVNVRALSGKSGMIMDIGDRSLDRFSDTIGTADAVFYAGPTGVYEKGFTQTIRLIARFMGRKSNNYTLGGNSSDSIVDIGLDQAYRELGGKIVTSGGAALEYLAGKEPAVLRAFDELKPAIRQL